MEQVRLPDRLETERLVLRVRTVADAEDIHAYASLPEVSYPAGFPPVKTLEDEIYYLEHILPERNQNKNLPAAPGIFVKGTNICFGVKKSGLPEVDSCCFGYHIPRQRVA